MKSPEQRPVEDQEEIVEAELAEEAPEVAELSQESDEKADKARQGEEKKGEQIESLKDDLEEVYGVQGAEEVGQEKVEEDYQKRIEELAEKVRKEKEKNDEAPMLSRMAKQAYYTLSGQGGRDKEKYNQDYGTVIGDVSDEDVIMMNQMNPEEYRDVKKLMQEQWAEKHKAEHPEDYDENGGLVIKDGQVSLWKMIKNTFGAK